MPKDIKQRDLDNQLLNGRKGTIITQSKTSNTSGQDTGFIKHTALNVLKTSLTSTLMTSPLKVTVLLSNFSKPPSKN